MKSPLEGRWLALIAVLVAGFLGMLVVGVRYVRLPEVAPPAARPGASVGIVRVDPAVGDDFLSDQSLLDLDPLFLPTRYNASQLDLPDVLRREPGAAFQEIGAKLTYSNEGTRIAFPDVIALPKSAAEVIRYGSEQDVFDGLARFNRPEAALPQRVAVLEVVQTKTGRVVLSAPLTPAQTPRAVASGDWEPLEFMAAVDVTGLVGVPRLWSGSGVEAVDVFFRNYLAGPFHLGERLPPGFYTLRVGP